MVLSLFAEIINPNLYYFILSLQNKVLNLHHFDKVLSVEN